MDDLVMTVRAQHFGQLIERHHFFADQDLVGLPMECNI